MPIRDMNFAQATRPQPSAPMPPARWHKCLRTERECCMSRYCRAVGTLDIDCVTDKDRGNGQSQSQSQSAARPCMALEWRYVDGKVGSADSRGRNLLHDTGGARARSPLHRGEAHG